MDKQASFYPVSMDKQAFQRWCTGVVNHDGSPEHDAYMEQLASNLRKHDPELGKLMDAHNVSRITIVNYIKSKTSGG